MSDFLTSLADRSIQASADLMPMAKPRFAEQRFTNGLQESPISEADWNVEQIEHSVEVDSMPVPAPAQPFSQLSIPNRRLGSLDAPMQRKGLVNESGSDGIPTNRITVEDRPQPITPVDLRKPQTEFKVGPTAPVPISSTRLHAEPNDSFDSQEKVFAESQPVFDTTPKRAHVNKLEHDALLQQQSNKHLGIEDSTQSTEFHSEIVVQESHEIVELHSDPIIEQVVEIIPRSVTERALQSPNKHVVLEPVPSPTPIPNETVVNVTIGRIEIRANVEGRRSDTRANQTTTRTDSLRDFLARRST